MLRAVYLAGLSGWRVEDVLDVVDMRTYKRLLRRGAITVLADSTAISLDAFLGRQHYIVDTRALESVERIVATLTRRPPVTPDGSFDVANDGASNGSNNGRNNGAHAGTSRIPPHH